MHTLGDSSVLLGKTVIITGANRGLGQAMAHRCLAAGATVWLACRSRAAAVACLGHIRAQGVSTDAARIVELDLSSLASVQKAAQELLTQLSQIDLLLLNAGVFRLPPNLTSDGFETHFAVNYLGHFAWTAHLWPALARSSAARVITVSSAAEPFAPRDFLDPCALQGHGPWRSYAFSKRCTLAFSLELDRRCVESGQGVRGISADPGFVATDLLTKGGEPNLWGRLASQLIGLSGRWMAQAPMQGSATLWAACTEPLDETCTGLLMPGGPLALWGTPKWKVPSAGSLAPNFVRELWRFSQTHTGLSLLD